MTFFDKYSYKQKNYALIVLVVLLLAVVYKRSILPMQELLAYRQELTTKLSSASSVLQDIRSTQQQLRSLNQYIGKENNSVEKVQQGFLNFFHQKSSDLSVFQIDEVHTYRHPDFSIKTHRIVLRGSYTASIRFIYDLETRFDLARVVSVSYQELKLANEENSALYTTILLQNYIR